MNSFKSALLGCLVAAVAVLIFGEHVFDVIIKSWGMYPIVIGLTAVAIGSHLGMPAAVGIGAPLTIMALASFVGDATFGWAVGGALVLVALALSAKPKIDERRKVAAEKKAEATTTEVEVVETTPTATTKTTLVQKTVAAAKAVLPKGKANKEPATPKQVPVPTVADDSTQVPAGALV